MSVNDNLPDQATAPVWEIAGVPVTGIEGAQPTFAPGATAEYRFLITPFGADAIAAGDLDRWSAEDHIPRYERFLQYGMLANSDPLPVAVGVAVSGDPWFREQHTGLSRYGIDSLVVGVDPPASAPTGRGIWGVLSGVTDETTLPREVCVLSVTIEFLAERDQYADADAVKRDLEANGL